jgi:hypothetical protein
MWKFHGLYESRPRSIIITVGGELYRIPRGSSEYFSTKRISQGNLSYSKIHPLHSLFKGCTKYHYNHCNINTIYPAKTDFRRDRRYCFFTYNGSYTMPHPTQIQQVGEIDSTPPTTSFSQSSTSQEAQLLQKGT